MSRPFDFLRQTAHLWLVLVLIAAAGAGYLLLRGAVLPESYGQLGPYRAAALDEIAARPNYWQSDATCLACHANVGEQRAGSLHEAVRCAHCHGVGKTHVAQAQLAAAGPGITISKAVAWDGKLDSRLDLFITKDRDICLSCHEAAVGMPADFHKITAAEHLDSQGAADVDARDACFECHKGHNTAP